ncbi:MAG: response regulator [Planctomycetota bacterium]
MAIDPLTWISLTATAGATAWALRSRRKLRQAQRESEATARQSLDRLLSNAAHELRTPLTALLGLTEVAEQPSLEPERRQECLRRALAQGRHLLELINDVFDYARMSEGRLTLHAVDVDLQGVLNEVEATVRAEADRKGLLLAIYAENEVPARVCVDPDRLRQVLRVLLQNAVKFTRRGHIGLTVGMVDDRALRFRVHDTGPGMSNEERRDAFIAFERGDLSPTRRHGGLGLGLALAAGAVKELSGQIQCDPHPGGGSQFTVLVPVQPARGPSPEVFTQLGLPREDEIAIAAKSKPAKRPKFRGQVLLVDDSRDNQLLIRTVLKQFGLESETAENGRIALRALEKQNYDLVLMDMQMPVLDGYSATNELRERGDETPVVALTAHALSGDREKCLDSGCDDFLTKPLDRQQLTRVLARYLEKAEQPAINPELITQKSDVAADSPTES